MSGVLLEPEFGPWVTIPVTVAVVTPFLVKVPVMFPLKGDTRVAVQVPAEGIVFPAVHPIDKVV